MPDRADLLLPVSAAVYGLAGIGATFAGEEILRSLGAHGTAAEKLLVPLLGAALFGFAMFNWINRHTRVGGIFGRPILVANLSHAFIAAMALLNAGRAAGFSPFLVAALATYAALALGYGARLYFPPRG